ncbi:MAG TPA: hypothetical protein VFE80_12270, partial [Beijerinckiaceae bacterium]|nr:hypothetical protein [Beijerinckiaceae bacterium]
MLAKGIEILDCASERAGDAAAPRWPAVLSLYGIVLLAGFGGSYAIQFLNLGLQQRGVSGSAIGLSTATQALGIVIAACVAVPVLNRLGSARTLALGSLIAGFALAAAALVESIEAVTMARFVCALGIGTLVTNVEYVVIARMPLTRRGDRGRRLRHGLRRRHGAGAGNDRACRLRRHTGAPPRRGE